MLRSVAVVVVLGLAGCLALAASSDWGVANIVSWVETEGSDASASASKLPKVTQRWQRPQQLISVPLPPRPSVVATRSVLFLPLVNRSVYRLHPRFADAFGHTLAAAGYVFGEMAPIAPALADRLGKELGFPDDYAMGNTYVLGPKVLEAAARRVGASSVVLLELSATGELRVRALDFGGAIVAGWNGISIDLWSPETQGRVDRRVLDGPRQLLEAIVSSGRAGFKLPLPVAVPASARDSLKDILASIPSGSLSELRRAELRLASLAQTHPGWRAPWIELATLRFLRPLSLSVPTDAALLREGPSAARHIARALGGLDKHQRARLDVIDLHFAPRDVRKGELKSAVGRLARLDSVRVATAGLHPARPRDWFGLEGLAPDTVFEALLLAKGRARGEGEAHSAVVDLAEQLSKQQRIWSPPLLAALQSAKKANGDWSGERAASLYAVLASWYSAMSVAREVCLDLPAMSPARPDCLGAIRRGLAAYATESELPDDPMLLADEPVWLSAAGAAGARLFAKDLPQLKGDAVPDVAGATASWTRNRWLATAEATRTANDVLAARFSAFPLATMGEMLTGDARLALSTPIERLLAGLYRGADFGRRRAKPDQYEPYLEILAPFDGFPTGLGWQAEIYDREGSGDLAAARLDALNHADPYDARWRKRWLYYFGKNNRYKQPAPGVIDRLEKLVPRTTEIDLSLASLYWRAFGKEEGIRRLGQEVEQHLDDRLAALYVDWVKKGRFLDGHRIEVLERTLSEYPHRDDLRAKLASIHQYVGNLERSRSLAETLLGTAQHKAACETLAYVEGNDGNPAGMVGILEDCADSASNKWDAARLYVRAGSVATNLAQYDRASALAANARKLVGGAAWVLASQAQIAEWSGDFDYAAELYEANYKHYKEKSQLRALADLYLRQGRVAHARDEMKRSLEKSAEEADYWVMAAIHLREGDFAGLDTYLRAEDHSLAMFALARAYDIVGDHEGAIGVFDELLVGNPESAAAQSGKAWQLLRLDRYDDAVSTWEPLLVGNPAWSYTARDGLIQTYSRSGRTSRARELVEEYAKHYPRHRTTLQWRAIVAQGEGRKQSALRWLAQWRQQTPTGRHGTYGHAQKLLKVLEREEKLGRPAQSEAELKRMIEQAEFVSNKLHRADDAFSLLSRLRALAGDAAGSQRARQTALRINPIGQAQRVANAK